MRELLKLGDLLPRTPHVSYQGDLDADLRGLTVRADSRRAAGKFAVMVTSAWGRTIATKYGRTDFAEYVEEALSAGVSGFVLPRQYEPHPAVQGANRLFVDDTLESAYAMAAAVRDSRGDRRITAITGSAGKSTTKAMLAHALRHLLPEGQVYSPGSSQNVATSQLGHLSVSDRFAHSVLEVAGSCFQVFRRVDFTISADVSVVTSISEAHLTYLKDLRTVAEEKAQLFDSPPAGGTAVINLDAPYSDLLIERATRAGCQLVTYGESANATIRLRHYDGSAQTVTAEIGREAITYRLGAEGKHMALNSLAVLATLRAYRLADWRAGVESLASFVPLKGRGQASDVPLIRGGTATLIDEAYNANPASMRAALEMLRDRPRVSGGRKIAVLGDILELGEAADDIHLGLVPTIGESDLDAVHFFGDHMRLVHSAVNGRGPASKHWTDREALAAELTATLAPGDIVLLKSSNGTGLGRVVDQIKTATDRSSAT